ncbi:MAG: Sir2 family NAD-dependent protein deacetylase [Verrucomicrobiota bacterium]
MAKLIILTGAGLSAESGLRTFRDQNGLWENHSINVVCNGHTWRANFTLVHRFYNARRAQLATAEPNAAHLQIAAWQSRFDALILTQNVDDLLERAGCRDVVHLHGFLPEMICASCNHIWNIGYEGWKTGARCPRCQSIKDARPNIVFFNEQAPQYELMWDAFASLTSRDVVVVIGTSGVVLPVSDMARQFRGFKILNNLAAEPAINGNAFDQVFYKPATQAVKEIDRIVRQRLEGA